MSTGLAGSRFGKPPLDSHPATRTTNEPPSSGKALGWSARRSGAWILTSPPPSPARHHPRTPPATRLLRALTTRSQLRSEGLVPAPWRGLRGARGAGRVGGRSWLHRSAKAAVERIPVFALGSCFSHAMSACVHVAVFARLGLGLFRQRVRLIAFPAEHQ
jgi:hypothetical protein